MIKPAISLEKVCKTYPMYHEITGGIKYFLFNIPKAIHSLRHSKYEALRDISFEVRRGETFGVIGNNGAGKSTMLGLIAGVLKPTSGVINVNGRISPLLALGSGFHPELTGRENIILNGVLLGLNKATVAGKMEQIIEFSELRDFINQPTRTYSSGMLARLGFSVVAHLDPEILLIDEVLAVGDMKFQRKCTDKMMEFRKSGVTIVFVSHKLDEVESICDRALWIDHHQIREQGSPQDIVRSYLAANITGKHK